MAMRVLFAALLLLGIGSLPANAACPGGVTASFRVTSAVMKPAVFNLKRLEQFSPAQENVTYFAMGSVVTESFTGALLWDLLNLPPVGGIVTNPNVKNDILHKIVIVTGSDCYQSVFGAGEIDLSFGDDQIIVAYATRDNRPAMTGLPGSSHPTTRRVAALSNIASIEMKDAGK